MKVSQYDENVKSHFKGNQRNESVHTPGKRVIYKSRNGLENEAFYHETEKKMRSSTFNSAYNSNPQSGSKFHSSQKNPGYNVEYQQNTKNNRKNNNINRPKSSNQFLRKNSRSSAYDTNKLDMTQDRINSILEFSDQDRNQDDLSQYPITQTTQTDNNEDEDKCFSIDYSFLDNLSQTDSRLQGVYGDELLNNPNLDLDLLMDQDPDYFHHIFGNCACAKCVCSKCKCRHRKLNLVYKNGFNTSYNKQFRGKKSSISEQSNNAPNLNQTHYETFCNKLTSKQNYDPSFVTTSKAFYKGVSTSKRENFKPQYKHVEKPIMQQTSYGSQFPHWQDYDPEWQFKAPIIKHTIGDKFQMDKRTSYKQQYIPEGKDQEYQNIARKNVKEAKSQPFSKIYNGVQIQTQYQNQHYNKSNVNRKINLYNPIKYYSSIEKPIIIPSFESQFKSIQKQEFKEKPFDHILLKKSHAAQLGDTQACRSPVKQSPLRKFKNNNSQISNNQQNQQWKQTLKNKLLKWRQKQRSSTCH